MSGPWIDDLRVGDDRVSYERTGPQEAAAGYTTLTTPEAAEVAGVARSRVLAWVREGWVSGVQVDGRWLFDRDELLACASRMRARRPGRARRGYSTRRLPAQPLLRHIELNGGDYELGVRIGMAEKRALERARETGWLTVWAADTLTVRLLGRTPLELWGDDYLTA